MLKIEDSLRVGSYPWAVVLSPDDEMLYVLNKFSGNPTSVDTLDHGAVRSAVVSPQPYAMLVDEQRRFGRHGCGLVVVERGDR